MLACTQMAWRSAVMRLGLIWGQPLGFAVNCVAQPTHQKRAYDYRNGEQVT
jgi:hypothetical protein